LKAKIEKTREQLEAIAPQYEIEREREETAAQQ